jgi:hypothetical protein
MPDDSPSFRVRTSNAEALRRQHLECRAVLDHQIQVLRDHDRTALRTARIAVLVLALVVSTSRFSNATALSNALVRAGSLGLVVTFCSGIFTHGVASSAIGPGATHVEDLLSGSYDERDWLYELLDDYTRWSREMRAIVRRNGLYVQATQLLLMASVVTLTAGIANAVGAV